MREHYEKDIKVKLTNKDLLRYMKDWCGNNGGIDSKGMFQWRTYNPDSKWDWYETGGRWRGLLQCKEGKEGQKGSGGWGWKKEELEKAYVGNRYDIAQLEDLTDECLKSLSTFAVLTENGEWIEQGSMGWFGMSSPNSETTIPKDIPIEKVEKSIKGYSPNYVKITKIGMQLFYRKNGKRYIRRPIAHKVLIPVLRKINLAMYNKVWKDKEKQKNWFEFRQRYILGLNPLSYDFLTSHAWDSAFYNRFLKGLPKDTTLTVVDCHI